MDENRQDYLSDEELTRMICQVEDHEMLRAPAYLRVETAAMLRRMSRQEKLVPFPAGRARQEKKRELFFYSLKVGAAAAAAMIMLIGMPVGQMGTLPEGGTERISSVSDSIAAGLGERMNRMSIGLGSLSDWLVSGGER